MLDRAGLDPAFYANRAFGLDEILPWDIIDCGVSKDFFLRERERAYASKTTPNCREACSRCGANRLGGERAVCPHVAEFAPEEDTSLPVTAFPDRQAVLNRWAKLEVPKTIRIKFRKVGSLQYISHLDLQRTFARVLVRAEIPMWYTQGFNPHAKVIFGLPLSVGTESECEYIDLRLDRDIPPEELRERLNRELTDEMQISQAYEPETTFREIAWADYEIRMQFAGANPEIADQMQKLYETAPLLMVKKTKAGEKEFDLIPWIRRNPDLLPMMWWPKCAAFFARKR